LGAVADMPVPIKDVPDIIGAKAYRDYGSLESTSSYLYDEFSSWEMEW